MINIKGRKAEALMKLYNASRPQGLGIFHFRPEPMSLAQAEALLSEQTCFDYLYGRVMKVNLAGDTLDPRLYDRDNGPGAAQRAINNK